MQLSIAHWAYEYLRWHWGSGRCLFDGNVLVGAAVRPLYARRLCEIAMETWPKMKVNAALEELFKEYPELTLAGREEYVSTRARLAESPEMRVARQRAAQLRQQERFERQAAERREWQEGREERLQEGLLALMSRWDEQDAAEALRRVAWEEQRVAREEQRVAWAAAARAAAAREAEAQAKAAQVAQALKAAAKAAQAKAKAEAPVAQAQKAEAEAKAEKLTLRVANNSSGYLGVSLDQRKTKPYQAQMKRGGNLVYMGCFATAEEAALCIARSPEGQAAAERAAAVERAAAALPPLSEEQLAARRAVLDKRAAQRVVLRKRAREASEASL